ncbi:hypothetical protein C5S32_07675, partial [ANME-1 cluster archaeon GoMg1]|nr:hypothetical protein [ANME-1 cluster archaeon GoMg1]
MDSSFGYRPGKSAKQAIEQIETVRDEGHEWVVDADIKAFFDMVNHEKLSDAVAELGYEVVRYADDCVPRSCTRDEGLAPRSLLA